jgi:hypothetical protein
MPPSTESDASMISTSSIVNTLDQPQSSPGLCSSCRFPQYHYGDQEVKLEGCGHTFHMGCIQNHMVSLMKQNTDPKCGVCSTKINRSPLDQIFDICFSRTVQKPQPSEAPQYQNPDRKRYSF